MASLLTLVTNARGMGPGHSAVEINGTVYTFEDPLSIVAPMVSGWSTIALAPYLHANAHRPVIVSQFNGSVDATKMLAFLRVSMASKRGYLTSGAVCSTMAAYAIDASIAGTFDPPGIDTPWSVYQHASRKGLVSSEALHWADMMTIPPAVRTSILTKLRSDYPSIYALPSVPSV